MQITWFLILHAIAYFVLPFQVAATSSTDHRSRLLTTTLQQLKWNRLNHVEKLGTSVQGNQSYQSFLQNKSNLSLRASSSATSKRQRWLGWFYILNMITHFSSPSQLVVSFSTESSGQDGPKRQKTWLRQEYRSEGKFFDKKPSRGNQQRQDVQFHKLKDPDNHNRHYQLNEEIVLSQSVSEVLSIVGSKSTMMNLVNIATCFSRLGKVYGLKHHQDKSLMQYLRSKEEKQQLKTLFQKFEDNLHSFDPRGFSNIVNAIGKIGVKEDLGYVEKELPRMKWQDFKPQNLANSVHAFAKLGLLKSKVYEIAVTELHRRKTLLDFEPQHVSNVVWSLVKAGYIDDTIFRMVEKYLEACNLNDFKPQELTNIISSFAKAGLFRSPLFLKIERHLETRDLNDFKPQELSNTLWSFATAERFRSPVFAKAEQHLITRTLKDFDSQAISNIIWSFAKAKLFLSRLFSDVEQQLQMRDMNDFTSHDISNIVWSFAKAGRFQSSIFSKVNLQLQTRDIKFFDSQHVSIIIWSLVKGNYVPDATFLASIPKHVELNIDKYNVQGISNICWAMAVLEKSSLLYSVSVKMMNALVPFLKKMSIEEKTQMYQFALEIRLSNPKLFSPLFEPYESFLDACKEAMLQHAVDLKSSQLHMEISKELNSMDFKPLNEFITDIGYVVDIGIERPFGAKALLIEVDGPSHFVNNQETMQSKMKKRHLRYSGYEVVSLPYFEWLENNPSSRKPYLLRKIKYL
jgi:hypothetical protein